MTLSEALDTVYGHNEWHNPIRPYFVSGVTQTPFEAFKDMLPMFQEIVVRLIGHEPRKEEE